MKKCKNYGKGKARGFSLIELMIALSILSFMLVLSAPSFTTWINSLRLRNQAESAMLGIVYAQSEAIRRNSNFVFEFENEKNSWRVYEEANPGSVLSSSTGLNYLPSVSYLGPVSSNKIRKITFSGLGVARENADAIPVFSGIEFVPPSGQEGVKTLRLSVPAGASPYICDPIVTDETSERFCRN